MSDLDVLTFSEARDFVKNPYVADQIHESEDKTLIVEIHSDLLTSQSEDFYAFAAETFSLNLFTVGLVTDNYPKEFATLLQGFDVLFSSFEDGVSVQLYDMWSAVPLTHIALTFRFSVFPLLPNGNIFRQICWRKNLNAYNIFRE